jgi:hypothetical protein
LVENGGGDVGPDALEGELGSGSEFGVELLAFGGIGFRGDGFDEECEILAVSGGIVGRDECVSVT